MKKAGVFAVVIATVAGMAFARPDAPAPAPVTQSFTYAYGADSCRSCHGEAQPDNPLYQKHRVYEFMYGDEYSRWNSGRDPHKNAYKVLQSEHSRAMQRRLRWDRPVETDPRCLTCHSVDHEPAAKLHDKKKFDWTRGVSCEACHGKADEWIGPHLNPAAWLEMSHEKKSRLGLVDLRDPATRAGVCASCHVGNQDQGKFVTHEMYAAGHPPLMPFEPVTFGRDQPAHWRLPEENHFLKSLDPAAAKSRFHFRGDESSVARSLAIGAVVNLRETARLLAEDAKRATAGPLDFAHYDCFSCHHDLESPNRRPAKPGVPGRPTMRLRGELAEAVLTAATGDPTAANELRQAIDAVRGAFDERPFGSPPAIVQATHRLIALCDGWISRLAEVRFDKERMQPAITRQILAAGLALGDDGWDYDTAQYFTWAVRALTDYEKADGPKWAGVGELTWLSAGLPESTALGVYDQRMRRRYEFDSRKFADAWRRLKLDVTGPE